MDNKQKLKILFISTDNSQSSGAFISMAVLNDYLNKKHNVNTEVILPKKGTGTSLLEEKGIKYKIIRSYDWLVPISIKDKKKTKIIFLIKRILNLKSIYLIMKEIEKEKPDIIHINTIYGYVGAIAGYYKKIPVVWHFREIIKEGHNKTFADENFGKKTIERSNSIISISKSVFNYYKDNGFNMDKATVIYNGIDKNVFYNKNKKLFEKEKIKILFVGDFSENKGAFTLLKAVERLEDLNRKIILTFVGNTNTEFNRAVSKSKIKSIVRIISFQKNIQKYYKKADIVVTGGKYEAFGRVTAESMMSGCLTITVDDYGSGELVKDGITGYSYKRDDYIMLAEKIKKSIENKEKSKSISKNGQKFICDNMTAEKNALEIYNLYTSVVN